MEKRVEVVMGNMCSDDHGETRVVMFMGGTDVAMVVGDTCSDGYRETCSGGHGKRVVMIMGKHVW
jgi:hypothetical protein